MREADRLIKKVKTGTEDSLEDVWYGVAYAVESSLMSAGSVQGDYTLLDLYSLAQPFVLEMWKDESRNMDYDSAFEDVTKSSSLNP